MEPTPEIRPSKDRSRRPLWVGLAISVAVHMLAFLIFPDVRDDLTGGLELPVAAPPATGSEAMEVIALAPFEEVRIERDPDEPVETPAPVFELPKLEGVPGEDVSVVETLPLSAAERLRTRFTVPELWTHTAPEALALPVEARERLVLGARIAEWYDSLAADAARDAALTDWTYTDSEGKRWGVADGIIYLGDIAVPVPFGFGVSNARREEVAERMWQWDELMRQGVRMELIDSWEDRQEAIRSRRDRERAAAADTGRVGR